MHMVLRCLIAAAILFYALKNFAVAFYGTREEVNNIIAGRCDVGQFVSAVYYLPALVIQTVRHFAEERRTECR